MVGGKKLSIRSANINDIYKYLRDEVIAEEIEFIHKFTAGIKDFKERVEVEKSLFKDLPKGEELLDKMTAKMNSRLVQKDLLVKGLKECNEKLSDKDLAEILNDKNNVNTIQLIMNHLLNSESDSEVSKVSDKPVSDSSTVLEKKI
jgi:signal recognition particle GTPase